MEQGSNRVMNENFVTARARGLMLCDVCGFLMQFKSKRPENIHCPRCGQAVYPRKPASLQRTAALVLAAAILYFPANMLPIMRTSTLTYVDNNTILSGIIELWSGNSWPLAIFVFFVSILVPLLKLAALSLLIISTHYQWRWRLQERTRLYRFLEFIGRWSMLDVFVVGLLVALVKLRGLATVTAGPGVPLFASVVILTMYASQAFDPRLMWDHQASSTPDPIRGS